MVLTNKNSCCFFLSVIFLKFVIFSSFYKKLLICVYSSEKGNYSWDFQIGRGKKIKDTSTDDVFLRENLWLFRGYIVNILDILLVVFRVRDFIRNSCICSLFWAFWILEPSKTKPRSSFKRLMQENKKKSLMPNIPFVAAELENGHFIRCTGIVVSVERKNGKNDDK